MAWGALSTATAGANNGQTPVPVAGEMSCPEIELLYDDRERVSKKSTDSQGDCHEARARQGLIKQLF